MVAEEYARAVGCCLSFQASFSLGMASADAGGGGAKRVLDTWEPAVFAEMVEGHTPLVVHPAVALAEETVVERIVRVRAKLEETIAEWPQQPAVRVKQALMLVALYLYDDVSGSLRSA